MAYTKFLGVRERFGTGLEAVGGLRGGEDVLGVQRLDQRRRKGGEPEVGHGHEARADAEEVVRALDRGEVVEGDTLTGDLDFLVLGAQPPMPAPLPPAAGGTTFRPTGSEPGNTRRTTG